MTLQFKILLSLSTESSCHRKVRLKNKISQSDAHHVHGTVLEYSVHGLSCTNRADVPNGK